MKTFITILVLIFIVPFVFPYKNSAQILIKGENSNIITLPTKDTLIEKANEIILIDSLINLKKQKNETEKQIITIKTEIQKKEIITLKEEIKKSLNKNKILENEVKVLKKEINNIKDSIHLAKEKLTFDINNKNTIITIDSICIKKEGFLGLGKGCKEWKIIDIYE